MSRSDGDSYTLLLRADRPEAVEDVREVLEDVGIPFRSGLMAGDEPGVFFTVPREYLEDAQAAIADRLGSRGDLPGPHDKFPWRPVQIVGTLILLHFAIVVLMIASPETGRGLIRSGALLKGATVDQPWRLLTSLFLHSDPLHVFWNGASMIAFAVPLLAERGALRTSMIYFASGIGGAVTALYFAWAGTMIIGSSGAVAGLFGAWVALMLYRARRASLSWRARIRTLGIAMLVLPSLLSPMTSTGHPVSVSSHLGGLATGVVVGAVLGGRFLKRAAVKSYE